MSDGWIEWAGGECPVHPDTRVELQFLGGGKCGPTPAHFWKWGALGGALNHSGIARYRIVRPPLDFHTTGAPAGDVAATLAEREGQYGSFFWLSCVAQALKGHIRASLIERNHVLDEDQEEAIDMICSKLARIVNGNADNVDSWHDIAGYAQLVADRLRKESQ